MFKTYDERKNGRTERLFLTHAIMYYCRRFTTIRVLRTGQELDLPIDSYSVLDGYTKLKIPMPDFAFDKHTIQGKIAGKTSNDFFKTENEALVNVPRVLDPDVYYERAIGLATERERRRIPARKRLKMVKKRRKRKKMGKKKNDGRSHKPLRIVLKKRKYPFDNFENRDGERPKRRKL